MTRYLLAIDPGTNETGLAYFRDKTLMSTKTLSVEALGISKKDPREKRLALAGILFNIFSQFPHNSSIICEEPLLQGRANTPMQRLLGMIEALAVNYNLNFIHPKTVKKLMGCGAMDKQEVAIEAGNLLTTDAEQDILAEAIFKEAWNETDAVAIGLAFMKQDNTNKENTNE